MAGGERHERLGAVDGRPAPVRETRAGRVRLPCSACRVRGAAVPDVAEREVMFACPCDHACSVLLCVMHGIEFDADMDEGNVHCEVCHEACPDHHCCEVQLLADKELFNG